jgi:CRP-like cAMP-binding protein
VVRQGDKGDGMYVIFGGVLEAFVDIKKRGKVVCEKKVHSFARGDFFGERALTSLENSGGGVRTATVRVAPTKGNVATLLKLAVDDFKVLIGSFMGELSDADVEALGRLDKEMPVGTHVRINQRVGLYQGIQPRKEWEWANTHLICERGVSVIFAAPF